MRLCSPALILLYDVPCGVVDGHVVEGVEVVGEGGVDRQVCYSQDPDVCEPEDLDFH